MLLASQLGPPFIGHGASGVITKFKVRRSILHPSDPKLPGWGVELETPGGVVLRVFNSHLTAYPYGPYMLRDGKTVREVEEQMGALQGNQMARLLKELIEPLLCKECEREKGVEEASAGVVSLVIGDHNIPSHLDHTEETLRESSYAAARGLWEDNADVDKPRPKNYAVDTSRLARWPVSRSLEEAGFKDAFRICHPDPVSVPGVTWTCGTTTTPHHSTPHHTTTHHHSYSLILIKSGAPKGVFEHNEVHDRIDYIYYHDNPQHVFPLQAETIDCIPDTPNGKKVFWPTDHRAVWVRLVYFMNS